MSILFESSHSIDEIRKKMQHRTRPDGGSVSYFEDHRGSICSTVYHPFSGLSFVKKDVNLPQFITNWRYGPVEAVSIEYCYEGSLECQIDEDYLYISSGDVVVFRTDPHLRRLCYPSSHYHAAQIVIYLEEISPDLSLYFDMVNISPEMIINKYLPDNRYYSILKNTEWLKDVFEKMIHAPDSVKNMYFGVKSLECLVLLSSQMCEINNNQIKKLSKYQAEMAKQVYQYAMEHPEERYSIDELAEKFSISPTQLKKYFQLVYGTSVQKFIREQKMKLAAKILETTDKKVTEVAQMFGYNNASKFAVAFKSVMGEYPKKYSLR